MTLRSNELVSVPICTFNGERYLARQIDSVLSQSHSNLEIIVSDDASKDGSVDLLSSYSRRDGRLKYSVNEVNRGFSENFSRAISACSGRFICPCDQDDIWRPEKVSTLLSAIGSYDAVYCDSEMIDQDERPLGRKLSQERGMYAGSDPLAFLLTSCASGHAMMFKRDLLERARPFPAGIYYDWWLAIVAASGNGIGYVDRPCVLFRRHESTVTTFGDVKKLDGVPMREYLEERRRLLTAMERLDTPRRADIRRLRLSLDRWLDHGNGLPFLWEAWKHRKILTHILRPRLGRVAKQSVKYLLSVGRRPG